MRVILGRKKGGKQQHENSSSTTPSGSTSIEASSVTLVTKTATTNISVAATNSSSSAAKFPSSTIEQASSLATADSIPSKIRIDDSISLKPKATSTSCITTASLPSTPTTSCNKERVKSPLSSLSQQLLSSPSCTSKTKSTSSNSRKRPIGSKTAGIIENSTSANASKKIHSAELPGISHTITSPFIVSTTTAVSKNSATATALAPALLDCKLPAVPLPVSTTTTTTNSTTARSSNNMRIIEHNNHNPHNLYHNNNPTSRTATTTSAAVTENDGEDPSSSFYHQSRNDLNNPAASYVDEGNSMIIINGQQQLHPNNNDNDDDSEPNESTSTTTAMTLFEKALKSERGLEIKEQEGDGNCLFRAISLQIYGDSNMHSEIRKRCLDFMEADEPHFGQFVTEESFHEYIARKRQDGVHGNNPEIQAISELFNRPIEVFVPENGAKPLNIFHAEYKTGDAPIRLSYHDGNHYNAVIDPLVPTAGLGLGLPGLELGLADRMQVAKAKEESDRLADEEETRKAMAESHDDEIQRAIKESSDMYQNMYKQKAMVLSDMEATEMELEQAILVSSLESYQQTEVGRKKPSHKQKHKHYQHQKQHQYQPKQHHRASDQQKQRATTKSSSSSSLAAAAAASTGGRSTKHPASLSPSSQPLPPSTATATPTTASATTATASASMSSPMASSSSSSPTTIPAATAVASTTAAAPSASHDEYPQTVQELVMNGFELSKVVRAYDLLGDNFDDILSYLMSTAT